MEPLKLYLGDLTHDTIVLVSDTIPINIGFVGSYAKKIYGDYIDVSLFKYPSSLIDAINTDHLLRNCSCGGGRSIQAGRATAL